MLKSFETFEGCGLCFCGRTTWWHWSLVKVRLSDLNFTPEISFALNVSFVFYQGLEKYCSIIAWPVVDFTRVWALRIHYTSLCDICLWSRPYHLGEVGGGGEREIDSPISEMLVQKASDISACIYGKSRCSLCRSFHLVICRRRAITSRERIQCVLTAYYCSAQPFVL